MNKILLALKALGFALGLLMMTIVICIVITEYAPLWLEIVFFGTCWVIGICYLTLFFYSKLKK